ncbi:MAG: cytochrome c3 family protein [Armatimonadota bacterium]
MKSGSKRRGLFLLLAAGLVGLLTAAIITTALADAPAPPEFLKTATYLTSGKCKMCHKTQFANWSATKHAKNAAASPWEANKEKPETPTPEMAARYTTGYNAATKTWAEKGTACEACHGPGSVHMKSAKDRQGTISGPTVLATPAQQVSMCGQCHGQFSIGDKRYAEGYKPGMDLLAMKDFKLDDVKPGTKMAELNEVVKSKHYAKGVTCTSCHLSHPDKANAHELKAPVNELCMSCHKEQTMTAHAPTAKEGDTCATCHMPDGQHSFAPPAK